MSDASKPFGQTFRRVLAAGMLVGVGVFIAALALNTELFFLGLLLALGCAALLFVAPAVSLALPAFRSRPAAARAELRVPGLVSGVGIAALGALWARAATAPGGLVGGLLIVAGGTWAVAQAIALPRAGGPGGVRNAVVHSGLVVLAALVATFVVTAVPKFAGTKTKAYVAAMRSDLRNLVTAEEAYYADSMRYTSDLGALYYDATSGVVGPTITLTSDGWNAKVGHRNVAYSCAVFVGRTPLPPATREGEPGCDDKPPRYASSVALVIALVLAAAAGIGLSLRTPPAAA